MSSNGSINLSRCRKIREYKDDKYKYIVFIQLDTNKIYLQIIFSKKFDSEEKEKLFLKSISSISAISTHPALLHIIDFGLNDIKQSLPMVITEYQPNGTLADINKSTPKFGSQQFTGTKKLINLLGIAAGMQFNYLNYFINKNLKPSNIYLDENFYPHILNITLTKEESDEIKCISRTLAQSDDLYYFGLIAYELITNTEVFTDVNIENKIYPDLTVIRNDWIQTFLRNCLSDDAFSKPKFDDIYQDLLMNRMKYQGIFGDINEEEVNGYINVLNEYFVSFSNNVQKQAKEGNIDSTLLYGYMLFQGCGIDKDKKESALLFKKAADYGKTTAMHNYGYMLQNGYGVPKDEKEAVKYYKMAADLGHPIAMNNYGLMLENGTGVAKDIEEAVKCYKKAADLGNLVSLSNYAFMLKNGTGITMNKEEAAKYFKIAADQGNHRGMFNYGQMMIDGDGIDKNVDDGLKMIKKAADQGYVLAMYAYASIHITGEDVPEDYKTAAVYFKMAADLGDSDAMLLYGLMLDNGDGIQMDKFEAIRYIKMAAYLGNEDAIQEYKRMSSTFSFSF